MKVCSAFHYESDRRRSYVTVINAMKLSFIIKVMKLAYVIRMTMRNVSSSVA